MGFVALTWLGADTVARAGAPPQPVPPSVPGQTPRSLATTALNFTFTFAQVPDLNVTGNTAGANTLELNGSGSVMLEAASPLKMPLHLIFSGGTGLAPIITSCVAMIEAARSAGRGMVIRVNGMGQPFKLDNGLVDFNGWSNPFSISCAASSAPH
jgi:hypothetical protein